MDDQRTRKAPAAIASIMTVVALTACSAGADREEASEPAPPVTLRIVTDDREETPAGEDILHFAQQVAERSDGAIRIEPSWHAAGDADDWDQANARLVMSGQAELGLIPARAWDVEGVRTLRALHAPFLVDTPDELSAVLTDETLVDRLLGGLDAVDVIGIELVPEGLRHPVGYDAPLLGPADYEGRTIRTPRSDTSEAVFSALGARTTTDEFTEHQGTEISYVLANDGIATANVVLFPKVHTLVANGEAWAELTADQRDVIEQAAAHTKQWALDNWPDEARAAAAFCAAGGELATASDAHRAELRRAVHPVYDELSTDADTAGILADIRALAGTGRAEGATCRTGPSARDASELNGSYGVSVARDELVALGVTDKEVIAEYAGERTIQLEDGTYVIGYATRGPDWEGSYDVVDDRMIWHWTSAAEDWSSATFTVRPDGSIVFSDWEDGGGEQWVLGDQVLFSTWTPAP